MSISPIGSNSPITRLQGSTAVTTAQGSQDAGTRAPDTVEISDSARYLGELKKLPAIREDKVAAARDSIAAGSYETPAKLAVTVNRLLEDL